MKKQIAFIVSIFLVLIASITLTIAFLSDKEQSENVFTVGKVSITLEESLVDTKGNKISGEEGVNNNTYHLLPGKTYTKDPRVTIKSGSEEAYVRMFVTINNIAEIETITNEEFLPEEYITGWDKEIWPCVNVKDNNDNTYTYEFRYHKVVNGEKGKVELEPLFESFTVPSYLDNEDLEQITDLKITVVANATQAKGFADAESAWNAFNKQKNTN